MILIEFLCVSDTVDPILFKSEFLEAKHNLQTVRSICLQVMFYQIIDMGRIYEF